jgi:hypothetical protein
LLLVSWPLVTLPIRIIFFSGDEWVPIMLFTIGLSVLIGTIGLVIALFHREDYGEDKPVIQLTLVAFVVLSFLDSFYGISMMTAFVMVAYFSIKELAEDHLLIARINLLVSPFIFTVRILPEVIVLRHKVKKLPLYFQRVF